MAKQQASETNDELPLCICGATLVLREAGSDYFNGKWAQCDLCANYVYRPQSVYHCPREKVKEHSNGYDICRGCAGIQGLRDELEKVQKDNALYANEIMESKKEIRTLQVIIRIICFGNLCVIFG